MKAAIGALTLLLACLSGQAARAAQPSGVQPAAPPASAPKYAASQAAAFQPAASQPAASKPLDPANPPAAEPAPTSKVSAGGILGRPVIGPDGQEIGRIVDVLVDAGSNPRAAVIDFGGFLGVGDRRVAVNWSDITFPPTGSATGLKLDLSLDQIRGAPAYTDQTKPASVVEPPPARPPPAAPH